MHHATTATLTTTKARDVAVFPVARGTHYVIRASATQTTTITIIGRGAAGDEELASGDVDRSPTRFTLPTVLACRDVVIQAQRAGKLETKVAIDVGWRAEPEID